jgi:LysR family transcriptional regulator, regulator for bpeEF and oprC
VSVTDLNDLKVFERVAALESFTAAGRALGIPKSTISRCVTRLETQLGVRLLQRTTHSVRLTESGVALKKRCTEILTRANEAIDYVSNMATAPNGVLKISASIGFGYFVFSQTLPGFLERHPGINVVLDLTSRPVDIVAEGIDVTIRIGSLPDSRLIATGLGTMKKYLCAAPSYLDRKGIPQSIKELKEHDTIDAPCNSGIRRTWVFSKGAVGDETVEVAPRLVVNDPGMIYRLALSGAGIASIAAYLATPDIEAGLLVRLLPERSLPSLDVSILYPSSRGLSPAVRAFVEHMKQTAAPGKLWRDDPIARISHSTLRPRYPAKRSTAKRK